MFQTTNLLGGDSGELLGMGFLDGIVWWDLLMGDFYDGFFLVGFVDGNHCMGTSWEFGGDVLMEMSWDCCGMFMICSWYLFMGFLWDLKFVRWAFIGFLADYKC